MHPAAMDPEAQFLGCVLWTPLPMARQLMARLAPDDDFARPMLAEIARLIVQVLALDLEPTPPVVLNHAISSGQTRGDDRIGQLSRALLVLYDSAPAPVMGPHFRALVVMASWRRAVTRFVERLRQAAETSPDDVLAALLDDRGQLDYGLAQARADTAQAATTGQAVA